MDRSPVMTYTESSVVCDALNMLRAAIKSGATPWAEYDGETVDGPENETSYRAAIDSAHALCIDTIETADEQAEEAEADWQQYLDSATSDNA